MLKTVKEELEQRLPQDWKLSLSEEMRFFTSKAYVNAIMEIRTPDGTAATVLVEVKKKPLEARDAISHARVWRSNFLNLPQKPASCEENIMVITPYLGQSARNELSREGISFADMTGNIRFVMRRPAVFIEAQGANKNPLRENVPLRSLKGRGSGRVVRGLLDYRPPFGVRELSSAIQASAASISRVVDLLEREAIISRDSRRGKILSVNWEQLIRRWTSDYGLMQSNKMTTYLEPRGIQEALRKLGNANFRYAITASLAAARYAPVAQSRLLTLYIEKPEYAEDLLELRKAETGGNVTIGRPFDPVVFERTVFADGLKYASVSQVAADLLTGPGRNPSEGEALITWMKDNEEKWRIPLTQLI